MDTLLVLLAAALIALAYAASLRTYPYRPCRRCDGLGRAATTRGRSYRLCRHCGGSGHALRPGARLLGAHNFRNPTRKEGPP